MAENTRVMSSTCFFLKLVENKVASYRQLVGRIS